MKDRDIAAAFIAELEASVEYETHDLPNGGTIRVKRTDPPLPCL